MARDMKKIGALIIAATMVFSSLAYVIIGFGAAGSAPSTGRIGNFVVDTPIDAATRNAYISSGFTFMRLYYDNQSIADFAASLPDEMKTVDGQKQLVVEKISSNETYVQMESTINATTITRPDESEIREALCSVLVFKPSQCLLSGQHLP